ncbi:MAG: DUF2905 domain-containing protein [Lautropia sp.]|nr:DUF2905 domain-containing protein [Lautropia sp.]
MIKWLITVVVALVLFAGLTPLLRRMGLGRLPGDFQFRLRGRDYSLPVASTVLLSLLVMLVARFV